LAYGRDFCFVKVRVRRGLNDKLLSLLISFRFLVTLVSQSTEGVILVFGFLAINIKPVQSNKIWPNEYNLIATRRECV